jgi:hypothetical protein
MRKLVVSVAVLLALLLVADRVAASIAAGVVADKLQASGGLSSKPDVSIKGFPFLTQALEGRYDRIDVSAKDVRRGGVRLARLDVTVKGARIPLGDALSGKVSNVPAEGLTATAVVQYVDIVGRSKIVGASVTPVPGGVKVTGRVTVLGQTVTASTVSTVRLEGRDIVIRARSIAVQGASSPAINDAIAGLLDVRVPVGSLPYGLRLTGIRPTSAGLVLSANSGPTVLRTP